MASPKGWPSHSSRDARAKAGGEGGIRTPVPVTRTRRFRGAPVTTTSVPLRLLLRSVGPLYIPHLAARSRPPSATSLRRSLAAAGAFLLRSVGPLYIPHLAARSRPRFAAASLRRSLAAAGAFLLRSVGPLLTFPTSLRARGPLRGASLRRSLAAAGAFLLRSRLQAHLAFALDAF